MLTFLAGALGPTRFGRLKNQQLDPLQNWEVLLRPLSRRWQLPSRKALQRMTLQKMTLQMIVSLRLVELFCFSPFLVWNGLN